MNTKQDRTELVMVLNAMVGTKTKLPKVYEKAKREVLKLYEVAIHAQYSAPD